MEKPKVRQKHKNKYHAKTVHTAAGTFASKKEYSRWRELKLLEQAGEISLLQRQVRHELIPAIREPDTIGVRGGFKKGRTIEKAVNYIADFEYEDKDGNVVVEDVKGYKFGTAYSVFVIKRKLMLWRFGIRVKEV